METKENVRIAAFFCVCVCVCVCTFYRRIALEGLYIFESELAVVTFMYFLPRQLCGR